MPKSFQFSDPEQESEFQEIYEKVKVPTFSSRNLTEKDLREVFVAGQEFEGARIKKKWGICSLGDE